WSDDFHHSVAAAITGTRRGYFRDFGNVDDIRKAMEGGFVYDGKHSAHRKRRHGSPTTGCKGRQMVVFIQNHDQIANGFGGQRLSSVASLELHRLATVALFAAPYLPLIFMGQEFAESAPFHYFVSHGDRALSEAVREGRRKEMGSLADGRAFA